MTGLTGAMVEEVALGWFQELGCTVIPGHDLNLGESDPELTCGNGCWRNPLACTGAWPGHGPPSSLAPLRLMTSGTQRR
jgi:hypothetical protein